MRYEVIVENVGTVYCGDNEQEANQWFDDYAGKYKPWGCDWYAGVTLIADGEVEREYCTPVDLHKDYNYSGDVNLEYGGTFYDLSNWEWGYVSAVAVTDLASACGAEGMVLIEHVVILLDRKSADRGFRKPHDYWQDAMESCGMKPVDLLKLDLHGKRQALAEMLHQYGRYDPDDGWDGYRTHCRTVVQCETDGLDESEGWNAEYRLDENETLEQYVLREHVTDTGYCRDDLTEGTKV